MQNKCKEGFILTPDVDQNEIIEITSIADHPTKHVSRKALTDIIIIYNFIFNRFMIHYL